MFYDIEHINFFLILYYILAYNVIEKKKLYHIIFKIVFYTTFLSSLSIVGYYYFNIKYGYRKNTYFFINLTTPVKVIIKFENRKHFFFK